MSEMYEYTFTETREILVGQEGVTINGIARPPNARVACLKGEKIALPRKLNAEQMRAYGLTDGKQPGASTPPAAKPDEKKEV